MPEPTTPPTREQVIAEPAGRQLDVWVAAHVMGWANVHDSDGYGHWTGDPPAGYEDKFHSQAHCEGQLPRYSTDAGAAWDVVTRLAESWGVNVLVLRGAWSVHLIPRLGAIPTADAGTMPLAVCRAALLAALRPG